MSLTTITLGTVFSGKEALHRPGLSIMGGPFLLTLILGGI